MTDRFRLLDLNEDCVKTVLQCFNHFDLISFSLCSKKRLANVRSLKLHIELRLFCNGTFYAQIKLGGNKFSLYFREDGYDRKIAELDIRPRRLQVDYIEGSYIFEPEISHWRKSLFSGNDWLRHIMSVFNCDEIELLFVMSSKFEIDSLLDTVQNLNVSRTIISREVLKEYTERLLNALPRLENLTVDSLKFHAPSEYGVLLRNQQRLLVQNGIKITLDIVLSVNSLAFTCFQWPIKDVNRFIKLWKRGANPRLRHLCVSYYANHAEAVVFNENEVLRGVQYQRMTRGTARIFEMPEKRMKIVRGFDIIGKSGRKATVTLKNRELVSSFRMFIWE